MKRVVLGAVCVLWLAMSVQAQIRLDKIGESIDLNRLFGQVLNVKHGFNPKFSVGNVKLPKINQVGELLGMKQNDQINKLFRTFKTGRTVFKVASYAGSAIALYGTIRALDKAASTKDYQGALIGGLSAVGAGLITKLLTKGAAYKAVDLFNGAATRKIKDFLSIQPASSTLGVGLYVKLN